MRLPKQSTAETLPETPVDPVRIIAAADAILRASATGPGGAVVMWCDETTTPRRGFAPEELMEGLVFLRRIGLLQPDAASQSEDRDSVHGG
jgi:hypothetical protein